MEEVLKTFITVVLGSGAAIAITRLVFDHKREERQRSDATSHLAILLAFQLESYAVDAADKAADHNLAIENEGHAGKFLNGVPQPQALPHSDAYKFFDRSLLGDVLDFPQRCLMANGAAMFWWNVVGDSDACNFALEENTIRMGYRAMEIAQNIRTKYELGDRNLTFGKWDIREFFEKELKDIEDRTAQREVSEKN